jgi:FixJ family two-component response regulator
MDRTLKTSNTTHERPASVRMWLCPAHRGTTHEITERNVEPAVFMSGYAESVLTARSALPPGAVLLDKPVSAHQLLTTISRVLETGDRIAAP